MTTPEDIPMRPRSPLPPFSVNICEQCWSGVSWQGPSEFEELLTHECYAIEPGAVWLHRFDSIDDRATTMVCGALYPTVQCGSSLIALPVSARDHHRPPGHWDGLARREVTIDQRLDKLNSILRDSLDAITLAIRDLSKG